MTVRTARAPWERGIDPVRIAAQAGDVAGRVRGEPGQHLLHVAAAHPGVRGGRPFSRQARQAAQARMRLGEGAQRVVVPHLARWHRPAAG
jgi:hypothetical protein